MVTELLTRFHESKCKLQSIDFYLDKIDFTNKKCFDHKPIPRKNSTNDLKLTEI